TTPALFFGAALLMFASSWRSDGPGALAIGLVGALLSLALMVLSARVAVAWTARILQARRARWYSALAAAVGLALAAPIAWLIVVDGLEIVLEYDARLLIDLLAYTPVGAPVAAAEAA